MKRKVFIRQNRNSWFVLYADRQKYGRYSAAQFDCRSSTFGQVYDWCKHQKNLELVEEKCDNL